MKLGKISYLNTLPYFHFLGERWLKQHQLVSAPPAQLGKMAREGLIDAAPFSAVDADSLVRSGDFEYLGNLGIAGRGPILSILLFGVDDPKSLEGKSIAVTSHTATTVRLMEIWLKEHIGIQHWEKVPLGQAAQATLLIGDEALSRLKREAESEPAPIDLCEAWTKWTGLPFVFARWAVRKSVSEAHRRELLVSLESALDLALDDLDSVAERAAEDSTFEPDFIKDYLRHIIFKLGIEEAEGERLFLDKLGALTGN